MLKNLLSNIKKELFSKTTLYLFAGGAVAVFIYMMIYQEGFTVWQKALEALGFALALCLVFALTKAYMPFLDEYYEGFRKKK
ncbi:MAG: hypothetical protein IKX74_07655 [Erysipelotrichaceae bacterium]|nr:hypothetical protein [Erysipelotrichaceae bacterium]